MLGQSYSFLDINRDWNSCVLACRWAHCVQNSSSNVAITSVEHKPLPCCFVSSFSCKMEVPATTPRCFLLRYLLPIQPSGSISWTPMKTCSRRKSSSLTGESLMLLCSVRTWIFPFGKGQFWKDQRKFMSPSPFNLNDLSCSVKNTVTFENSLLFSHALLPFVEVGWWSMRVQIKQFQL